MWGTNIHILGVVGTNEIEIAQATAEVLWQPWALEKLWRNVERMSGDREDGDL